MPKELKSSHFSFVSEAIFSKPPSKKSSLGDLNFSLLKFGLLLILTTVPPSSSTPISIGIFETF